MMPAMSTLGRFAAGAIAAFGAACATLPSGPTLDALPGSRMSAEQFAADDARCRAAVAERLAGRSATDAANQNIGASAAAGTAIGAATGAVFDGRSGAAAGAVVGLAMGAIAGANASQGAWVHAQQQYDGAYYACMYAMGHKVPVPAADAARYRAWFEAMASNQPATAAPVLPAPPSPPPRR